jgi:hypothetical protein
MQACQDSKNQHVVNAFLLSMDPKTERMELLRCFTWHWIPSASQQCLALGAACQRPRWKKNPRREGFENGRCRLAIAPAGPRNPPLTAMEALVDVHSNAHVNVLMPNRLESPDVERDVASFVSTSHGQYISDLLPTAQIFLPCALSPDLCYTLERVGRTGAWQGTACRNLQSSCAVT